FAQAARRAVREKRPAIGGLGHRLSQHRLVGGSGGRGRARRVDALSSSQSRSGLAAGLGALTCGAALLWRQTVHPALARWAGMPDVPARSVREFSGTRSVSPPFWVCAGAAGNMATIYRRRPVFYAA